MTIAHPNRLLDALEIGVLIVDDTYHVHYWNKWLEINTTIPAAEIMGKNLRDFFPNIDYRVFARKIRTTLRLNSPTFYDATLQNRFIEIPRTKITTSLLTKMQLQVTVSPYSIEGNIVMVSIYDISDLHELKLALQQQMAQVTRLNRELKRDQEVIDSNLLVAKIDAECRVLEVTKAFETFFGIEGDELAGRPFAIAFGDGIHDFDPQQMRDAVEQNARWSGEVKALLSGGRGVWLDATVTPIAQGEEGEARYTVILNDISDKKRIEHLSMTDPLTKLFNRNKFNDVFKKMLMRRHWEEKNSFGLIIIDIDHFKKINDTYGHQRGDQVLVVVANVLGQAIRTGDILARWGGEEFVCLLPDVDMAKTLLVAEKLRLVIENTDIPEVGRITSSFGVSLFKENDTDESLMRRADIALYRAKENGRNRVESL